MESKIVNYNLSKIVNYNLLCMNLIYYSTYFTKKKGPDPTGSLRRSVAVWETFNYSSKKRGWFVYSCLIDCVCVFLRLCSHYRYEDVVYGTRISSRFVQVLGLQFPKEKPQFSHKKWLFCGSHFWTPETHDPKKRNLVCMLNLVLNWVTFRHEGVWTEAIGFVESWGARYYKIHILCEIN